MRTVKRSTSQTASTLVRNIPYDMRLWLLSHFLTKLALATKEITVTLSANWFISCQPFQFAFTAVVGVHCLQSCLQVDLLTLMWLNQSVMNVRVQSLTGIMIHSTKAQLGQCRLATDSQRVMSDCLSFSLSRQSMTPSMQHDHINNITKIIQCTDYSFRTLARGNPSPQ